MIAGGNDGEIGKGREGCEQLRLSIFDGKKWFDNAEETGIFHSYSSCAYLDLVKHLLELNYR